MKYIQKLLVTIGRTALLSCAITLMFQHTSTGQEPVGPTKPVVVVNTPNEPVPVTGTITGNVTLTGTSNVNVVNTPTIDARQSGAWNVGLTGIPTVRIDPTSNNVQLVPRGTVLLFDSGVYTDTGRRLFGPINIAPYSKIKVSVTNVTNDEMFVNTWIAPVGEPFGASTNFRLDNVGVGAFSHSNKVYEAAGGFLYIDVFLGEDPNTVRVGVWGI